MENGADPNKTNRDGETPLEITIGEIRYVSELRTLHILLENGADPNIRGSDGYTALTNAIH